MYDTTKNCALWQIVDGQQNSYSISKLLVKTQFKCILKFLISSALHYFFIFFGVSVVLSKRLKTEFVRGNSWDGRSSARNRKAAPWSRWMSGARRLGTQPAAYMSRVYFGRRALSIGARHCSTRNQTKRSQSAQQCLQFDCTRRFQSGCVKDPWGNTNRGCDHLTLNLKWPFRVDTMMSIYNVKKLSTISIDLLVVTNLHGIGCDLIFTLKGHWFGVNRWQPCWVSH